MIDPQAEAIKRLVQQAKSGSQRTPLVPRVMADPDNPPVGSMWIRGDENKAYLKISDTLTQLLGSGSGTGVPGGDIEDRSLTGIKLSLNTVTSDELASGAVGTSELQDLAVTGDKWAPSVAAETNLFLDAQNPALPALRVDAPFDHATDIVRFEFNGAQRLRLTPTRLIFGNDLTGSVVSIQTTSTDTALRVRSSGGPLLLERQNGSRLLSVDGSGNLIVAGSITSQSGDSGTAGSMAVQGALTVTDQANMLAGLQVAERVDFLAEFEVDGQSTFNSEVFLPANYSARIGQAVHLRTLAPSPNRVLLEGVSDLGIAEIQLGTGGPVLRGSAAEADRLYIGSQRIMTSAASGISGSQIATDTITGGTGAGLGNIAAETITGYNIKNASITSLELSPGAVVQAAIAEGAVGSVQLADGSVVDRVVASMGVGKLISGTLNADEIFMGPSGHIYLGPTFASEINDERVQIDASGIKAYNQFGTALAEFTPGGFTLRTSADASRLEFDAANGLELFGSSGERTGYLSPAGEFQLDSLIDGARMSLNSQEGVQFYAGATRNLAFNPGFIGGSEHELPVAGEASNDQRHVFAGEYAVKFRATNPNINAPSYVDVPFKNTVGSGTSVSRTRKNFCTNPKLSASLTGWTGTADTGQVASRVSTLGFQSGQWVAQVQATGVGAGEVRAPLIGVSSGQQWAMSTLVRVSSALSVTALIRWYDVDGLEIGSEVSDPFPLPSNVVTQVGVVGVAPSNAATARLQITASLKITDTLQVSGCLYERVSGIDVYFDGDTPGYQWDGTPGISTSSLVPVPVPDSPDNLISIFVWSDVPAWAQIEGRDSTAGVSRGMSTATQLIPNQWSRISVQCTGVMDKVRLHYPSADPSRQTRITASPIWWSGLQVEADKATATPFCSGNEPGCRWEGLPGLSASVRDRDVVVTQISPTLGTTVSGAIVGGSMTSASFFAGRIFGTEIVGVNITGSVLRGNLIHGDQILAGTIQGTSLSARTIDAGSIKVGTLTGLEIQAGSIHGDRITAGTIQADRIGALQITAEKIAAGAITADKLQADLVLTKRMVIGTLTGARVQLHPSAGIEAYRTDGTTRTFHVDPATGNILTIGTFRTDASGERIHIDTDGTQTFYNSSGGVAGKLENIGTSGLAFRGPSVSNNQPFLEITAQRIGIWYGPYTGNRTAQLSVNDRNIDSNAPVLGLRVNRRFSTADGIDHRVVFIFTNTSGSDESEGILHYERHPSMRTPRLRSTRYDVGFTWWDDNSIRVVTYGDSYRSIWAQAFPTGSSRELKDEIADLDDEAMASLKRLRPRTFRYKNDIAPLKPPKQRMSRVKTLPNGRTLLKSDGEPELEEFEYQPPTPPVREMRRLGFVAEEMEEVFPEVVEGSGVGADKGINMQGLIPVLVKALVEIDARLDALEARLPGPKK